MLIATVVGGIGSGFAWLTPNIYELLLLVLLGLFGYFGQLYMTKAFQEGEASKVAPFKYVEVVFTLTVGVFWFDEVYTLYSLAGIFLVISSLTLSVLYKSYKTKS